MRHPAPLYLIHSFTNTRCLWSATTAKINNKRKWRHLLRRCSIRPNYSKIFYVIFQQSTFPWPCAHARRGPMSFLRPRGEPYNLPEPHRGFYVFCIANNCRHHPEDVVEITKPACQAIHPNIWRYNAWGGSVPEGMQIECTFFLSRRL